MGKELKNMFELRFESIGGMGANLAGKILAEAAVLQCDLNACGFASYGSEKKGTPVKSFIRITPKDQEIRINTPVLSPDILVVFHELFLKSPGVLTGIKNDTIVIVNSKKTPKELSDQICAKNIATLNASKIGFEEKVKINTVMLGAISKVIDFISPEDIKNAITHTLGSKYPQLLPSNLKAFDRGYNELNLENFPNNQTKQCYQRVEQNIGYKNQPLGGTITTFGNSVQKNLSTSREGLIPVWDKSKCVRCGECTIVCPDMCFVWEEENGKMELKGIDYQYCKGCLRCVSICKFAAIQAKKEDEVDVNKLRYPHPWNRK